MRIAIASGKGGTGKTTVATNLAVVASQEGNKVCYLDCDVEEPNGHVFLKPRLLSQKSVGDLIPQVDAEKCIHCGKCATICQFNAIVCIKEQVLVYPELCHACGGCALVCPAGAISETPRYMGVVEDGAADSVSFAHGILNVGEIRSIPVISAVKEGRNGTDLTIIDAPPGTSCPVIEAIRGADFVLLVTEPTPFGLHDLKLAIEMVSALKLPMGVVVNRANPRGIDVRTYCNQRGVPILAEIVDDRKLAEAYSRGEIASVVFSEYRAEFSALLESIWRAHR